jgi:hypothetical protein
MTTDEIADDKRRTDELFAKVVQELSNDPDSSLVHQVQKAGDGIVIPYIPDNPAYAPVYLFALPWSRGVSIFVTTDSGAGVYSWRDVPKKYRHLQAALFTPRGTTGPYRVHPNRIVTAIRELVKPLNKLRSARQRRAERLAALDYADATPAVTYPDNR